MDEKNPLDHLSPIEDRLDAILDAQRQAHLTTESDEINELLEVAAILRAELRASGAGLPSDAGMQRARARLFAELPAK